MTFTDPTNTTVLGSVGLDRSSAVEFSPGNGVDGPWRVENMPVDGGMRSSALMRPTNYTTRHAVALTGAPQPCAAWNQPPPLASSTISV